MYDFEVLPFADADEEVQMKLILENMALPQTSRY